MHVPTNLNILLLQIRNPDDPMRFNEVAAFAGSVNYAPERITTIDLIHAPPSKEILNKADVVLIGGAGDYSVPEGGSWLAHALDAMRSLYAKRKPVFASCWGFQAVAASLGGSVISDPDLAELGTLKLSLTEDGVRDPVFGSLGVNFLAHVGHNDTVTQLPEGAIRLAGTSLVANHAFRMADAPMYCTQFHSELTRDSMVQRLLTYPQYTKEICGLPVNELIETLRETPGANNLIRKFLVHVFGS